MFSRTLLRTSARAVRAAAPRPAASALFHTTRPFAEPPKGGSPIPGGFARTDESITVEYPEEDELPSSAPVTGRGGLHMKRTLASFSLEGRVGVVTGGARGLGLVMGQGMVISGSNLAIVDMNSESFLIFVFELDLGQGSPLVE
jgi:D-arabinitol 2-dehydrogenase